MSSMVREKDPPEAGSFPQLNPLEMLVLRKGKISTESGQ